MRHYKQLTETGTLLAIGTGPGGQEITKTEYDELLAMIREKARLVDALYKGEIAIDEVPEEWREEVQRRVNQRKEAEAAMETEEISDAELAEMMEAIL